MFLVLDILERILNIYLIDPSPNYKILHLFVFDFILFKINMKTEFRAIQL